MVNLQDGLRRLITSRRIEFDDGQREELLLPLTEESGRQVYEGAPIHAVKRLQRQHQLEPGGKVDQQTADLLNAVLKETDGFASEDGDWDAVLAALNQQTETLRAIGQDTGHLAGMDATVRNLDKHSCMVSGQVRRTDTQPAQGSTVYAFHETGQAAIGLGQDVTDREGHYTIRYDRLPGVDAINLRVTLHSNDGRMLASSQLIPNACAVEELDLVAPLAGAEVSKRSITSRVTLQDGRVAEGITLRFIRQEFGGRATTLDETTTQVGGRYALSFTLDPAAANLQILAIRPTAEEVPLEAQLFGK